MKNATTSTAFLGALVFLVAFVLINLAGVSVNLAAGVLLPTLLVVAASALLAQPKKRLAYARRRR